MPKKFPHVVVLLPGIMGSVLKKDGKDAWGPTGEAFLKSLFSLGESIKSLKLEGDDPELDDLGDGVTADRLNPDVHILPGLWKIDGYSSTAELLIEAFNLERGRNFFEFPYDWRRDNRVAARLLARSAEGWLNGWKQYSGNDEAKLILVGHSMGGLVSRYFLEVLDGWRMTRMLVTLGTPYRGSLNALNFISNGIKKKIGPVPLLDLTEALRSFTSIYQLLPTYRCVDTGEGDLLSVSETDRIPELDLVKTKDAMKFHDEIDMRFQEHRKDPVYAKDYLTYPIVGIFQATNQSAVLKDGKIEVLQHYAGEDLGGDGTVPRVSAVPKVENSQLMGRAFSHPHGSLQSNQHVLNQIEYALSGLTIDDMMFRDVTVQAKVGLDIEDLYTAGEHVRFRVRCTDPSRDLEMSIRVAETNEEVSSLTIRPDDENWSEVELRPLEMNTYRLDIGGTGVNGINDLFLVVE